MANVAFCNGSQWLSSDKATLMSAVSVCCPNGLRLFWQPHLQQCHQVVFVSYVAHVQRPLRNALSRQVEKLTDWRQDGGRPGLEMEHHLHLQLRMYGYFTVII